MICEQCQRDADPPKCWFCGCPVGEKTKSGCPPEFQEAIRSMKFEWNGVSHLAATYGGEMMRFPFGAAPSGGSRLCVFPPAKNFPPLFMWMGDHNVRVCATYRLYYMDHFFYMDVAMTEKTEDHWWASVPISDQQLADANGKVKFTFGAGVLP